MTPQNLLLFIEIALKDWFFLFHITKPCHLGVGWGYGGFGMQMKKLSFAVLATVLYTVSHRLYKVDKKISHKVYPRTSNLHNYTLDINLWIACHLAATQNRLYVSETRLYCRPCPLVVSSSSSCILSTCSPHCSLTNLSMSRSFRLTYWYWRSS